MIFCVPICLLLVAIAHTSYQRRVEAQDRPPQPIEQAKVKVRFVARPNSENKAPESKYHPPGTKESSPKPTNSETKKKVAATQDPPATNGRDNSNSLNSQKKPNAPLVKESQSISNVAKVPANDARRKIEDGAMNESADLNHSTREMSKVGTSLKSPDSKELSKLRLEQAKDSGECPGGSEATKSAEASEDDIPLEHSELPYDAPAAKSKNVKLNALEQDVEVGRLSSTDLVLRHRINDCLEYYLENPESATRRSPWAVMHATLPFGVETELQAGSRRVNAIGWMCYNGLCKTQRLFQPTRTGFRTNIGPGVQGHEGQLLAILAQSHVSPQHPIRIGNANYTVFDLARFEMATCREKSELTFKLIGLSYYLESDHRWRDNQGKTWSLEKLVAEELQQPVIGAACGGTHRLMGFSYSLAQRKYARLPVTGHWLRAEQFLDDFVSYALSLQNPDGSFSTEWFERRANEPNLEKKVQTTGHILEWLVFTVPDSQLTSEPIQRAITFLSDNVSDNRQHNWPIGPRGHSLRALALYNQRVFAASPGNLREHLVSLQRQADLR